MKIEKDFWESLVSVIDPIPTLQNLHAMFLDRDVKRFPKWRFRMAEDLAIQVQLKAGGVISRATEKGFSLTTHYEFDCRALEGQGVRSSCFTSKKSRRESGMYLTGAMSFKLVPGDRGWHFKPWRILPQTRGAEGQLRDLDIVALRARLLETLKTFPSFSALVLLSDNCVCCGKGLTDPVSRGRMIGSECWQKGFRIGEQGAGGLLWQAA